MHSRSTRVGALFVVAAVLALTWSADSSDDLLAKLGGALKIGMWHTFSYLKTIQLRVAVDYRDPVTWHFLLDQVAAEHSGEYCMAQVCDIWDYCREHWRCVKDPTLPFDQFSRASEAVAAGLRGDCDDFAVLVASGIRVVDGTALIVCEHTAEDAHAFNLVFIGVRHRDVVCGLTYVLLRHDIDPERLRSDDLGLFCDEEGRFWLNLDWTAPHPGGPRWTDFSKVTRSYALPIPSILWLLLHPLLKVPEPPPECTEYLQRMALPKG